MSAYLGCPQLPSGTTGAAYGTPDLDYRPDSGGPAASGAKPLASTGWPGATNAAYFGAVDPNAATDLGAVGIPAGAFVGPDDVAWETLI